jgi:hypothetical protein
MLLHINGKVSMGKLKSSVCCKVSIYNLIKQKDLFAKFCIFIVRCVILNKP